MVISPASEDKTETQLTEMVVKVLSMLSFSSKTNFKVKDKYSRRQRSRGGQQHVCAGLPGPAIFAVGCNRQKKLL